MLVTDEHIELFAQLSGDRNPLHFDEDFARKTKFGRRVVHGGVTAAILNALVAEDLPGPGSVFMEQHLKYTAPVHRRHDHRGSRGVEGAGGQTNLYGGGARRAPGRRLGARGRVRCLRHADTGLVLREW
jgi:hypothetical protein